MKSLLATLLMTLPALGFGAKVKTELNATHYQKFITMPFESNFKMNHHIFSVNQISTYKQEVEKTKVIEQELPKLNTIEINGDLSNLQAGDRVTLTEFDNGNTYTYQVPMKDSTSFEFQSQRIGKADAEAYALENKTLLEAKSEVKSVKIKKIKMKTSTCKVEYVELVGITKINCYAGYTIKLVTRTR